MEHKVISFRLNLEKLTDQKVGDILSDLPARRKSEYIRNAMLAYNNYEKLIEPIKRALLEAMDERDAIQAEKRKENDGGYNDNFSSIWESK